MWNFINDILGTGDSSARVQNQQNRDFQMQMSNTAVTRRMQDLKDAGINPILAGMDGATGASTPSGNAGAGGQASGLISAITNSSIKAFSNWANSPVNANQGLKKIISTVTKR